MTDATGRSVVSEAPMRVLSNGRVGGNDSDTWCLQLLQGADTSAIAAAPSNVVTSSVSEVASRSINTVKAGIPGSGTSSYRSLSLPSPSAGPDGQVQAGTASAYVHVPTSFAP